MKDTAGKAPKRVRHSEITITCVDGSVVTGRGENLAQAVAAAGRQAKAEDEATITLTPAGWEVAYRMLKAGR